MNALTNSGGERSEVWGEDPSRAADGNRKHLAGLSDRELLEGTHTLLGAQRRLTARLVGYLAEIEERRLHLKAACSSMFDFCLQRLGMSEGEAFRRLAAARLARRFPIVLRLVETGAVHLSALALAQHHLTEENHAALLREMSGKTKRAVLELLARRFPKPDVPSTIRKLPEPALSPTRGAVSESAGAGAVAMGAVAAGAAPLFDVCDREQGADRSTVPFSKKPSARIEPLSEARYRIQFTASATLKDKIERAQNLLRHKYPSGDLAAVMERAVEALLVELEKKTLGKTKRRRSAASKAIQVGKTQAEKDEAGRRANGRVAGGNEAHACCAAKGPRSRLARGASRSVRSRRRAVQLCRR